MRMGWSVKGMVAGLFFLISVLGLRGQGTKEVSVGPPRAEVRAFSEEWHGTKVVDNYRWLEDGSSPETKKWVAAESAYTRSVLDAVPGREEIRRRVTELSRIGEIGVPKVAGKFYFYTRREGAQERAVMYVREGIDGKDRALVDVNAMAADGTVSLDWFFPAVHGKYVAYGTSSNNSTTSVGMSTLHVIETKSGNILPDTIERTRACSVAWSLDNSGFYYTKYPKKGDVPEGQERYNRHVFYHELGTDPEKDPLIFGEGRDAEDWPSVSLDNDGRMLLITVAQGSTKSELFLMDLRKGTPPTRITTGKNFIYRGTVYNGRVYILTDEDAPRYRMFVTEAGVYDRDDWKEIIPQTGSVLKDAAIYGGKIFAQYEQNAASQIKVFSVDGTLAGNLEVPAMGTVFGSGGQFDHDEIFYGFESFTTAPVIYRYSVETREVKVWARVEASSIDASAYEVEQEWFQSKDGTRVPMFLVHKKGLKKDGRNPTLLTGYGGFGVSETPRFEAENFWWLEHGGIYAVANLRGGGEFGEEWHRAGMLDKKQNVFDDMIAAAEYLVAEKYTDRDHLALRGRGNGGLVVEAVMTQRPELVRAVVCESPVLDMLRYQNFGTGRLWISEYGTAESPEQFKWLYGYSPYHRVKAGVEYPAMLFVGGEGDGRKMVAAMRSGGKKNVLLETGSSGREEEGVDLFSFLAREVEVR